MQVIVNSDTAAKIFPPVLETFQRRQFISDWFMAIIHIAHQVGAYTRPVNKSLIDKSMYIISFGKKARENLTTEVRYNKLNITVCKPVTTEYATITEWKYK